MWRILVGELDNAGQSTIGDTVMCEMELGLPAQAGICGQILQMTFRSRSFRADFLTLGPLQRKVALDYLADTKNLGGRLHWTYDIVAITAVFAFLVSDFVVVGLAKIRLASPLFYVFVVAGLVLTVVAYCREQKLARREHLLEAIRLGHQAVPPSPA
jgi:hypothetical protein